ncbi:MAG: site-specific integrase [Candidatus Tectomicrobia bacterium]|uniref:Site-specific integrase n=1 Tax=Tectimicrobiota bacterium TaxID=2528274 RepID=A0A933GLX9_UNCTE|nr:site-specific integrase [Candidatus Tectomicrobia bacterium]
MIILKPDDIHALLDATGTKRERTLFMTAILTGMREGELLGLKWDDIDWRNSQIYVRRTFNHGRFYEPKTKTSRRKIDLAPELIIELKKWRLACPISELDLVFPTKVGTPEDAKNMLRYWFWPALRRTGLPRIRFQDLRHTYASLLIFQGEHPKYIQSQLGHSSIIVTMDTYGHLMKSVNQEAATRLGKMIFGSSSETTGSKMVAEMQKGDNQ